jgi:hypothetical protein
MKNSETRWHDVISSWSLIGLALVTCAAGIHRVLDTKEADQKSVDQTALLFFAASGGLLLLRDVKAMSIGDYKVEFDRRYAELESKVENAQSLALGGGGSLQPDVAAATSSAPVTGSYQPGTAPEDPWKGVFGGRSVNGTRELSADISPMNENGHCKVQLRVCSTNPARHPLQGSVQFFLHNTFVNDRPVISVSPGGVAEITLTAWGAFTVGAVADGGSTPLELDLAELETAPLLFRSR